MPSSRPNLITHICEWLRKHKHEINSVLDVGAGYGKWGFLTREYAYNWRKGLTLSDYTNYKEKFRVDGIEIYPESITELQKAIYNEIFVGDATEIIDTVDDYDLIIFGDVVEHMEIEKGKELLLKAINKSKFVLVMTPTFWTKGDSVIGNKYEIHKCLWLTEDFYFDKLKPKYDIVIGHQRLVIYEK